MIQIFNGRSRGLGQEGQDAVYLQVSVALRGHLHHFKGARLGVFMAIALHSNADGWAWPSMAALKAETGYNVQTISQALHDLCVLTIDDQRVLLAVQQRTAQGAFASNRYLLFPSAEEVAQFEPEDATPATTKLAPAMPLTAQPRTEKPSTAQPNTEKAHERRTMGNKNQKKEEPGGARTSPVAAAAVHGSSGEHPAIAAYRAAFGRMPTERQYTVIAETVTDLDRWRRVLDDWQENAWRAESVGKMLDRYRNQAEEQPHAPPVQRPADGRPSRPSAAPTPAELARFLNRPRPGGGQPGA
jgi:hypothetical protein